MLFNPQQSDTLSKQKLQAENTYIQSRNKACKSNLQKIHDCRLNLIKKAVENDKNNLGFLPCKRDVDLHFACLTEEKFGQSMDDVPTIAQQSVDNFFKCAFKQLQPMDQCQKHFDQLQRNIFRQLGNNLDDDLC